MADITAGHELHHIRKRRLAGTGEPLSVRALTDITAGHKLHHWPC